MMRCPVWDVKYNSNYYIELPVQQLQPVQCLIGEASDKRITIALNCGRCLSDAVHQYFYNGTI